MWSGNSSNHAGASDVRSNFTYTAASTRYVYTNSSFHPFEHIHASSAITPSSNHHHRQHHHETYTLEIEIKLRRQFPEVRYALTFLKRGGLALVLETPKEINTILKQSKWDEDFFGKDLYIHLANKDARPWLCVNKVPPTMDLAKVKERLSKINPVVGMKNWVVNIEGLHRKFKRRLTNQFSLKNVHWTLYILPPPPPPLSPPMKNVQSQNADKSMKIS